MKIRKLILNGEEQYTHTLPIVDKDNLPEDAQDGEMFLTMDNDGLVLLIFKNGYWWYIYLNEGYSGGATEK